MLPHHRPYLQPTLLLVQQLSCAYVPEDASTSHLAPRPQPGEQRLDDHTTSIHDALGHSCLLACKAVMASKTVAASETPPWLSLSLEACDKFLSSKQPTPWRLQQLLAVTAGHHNGQAICSALQYIRTDNT